MSGGGRDSRSFTDLRVVLYPSQGDKPLDGRALVREASVKGFTVETRAELAQNMPVRFAFQLPTGDLAIGEGRVVWSKNEFSLIEANIEILSMPWRDNIRFARFLDPDRVDWARLARFCVKFAAALAVLIAAHRVYRNATLCGVLLALMPKIIALCIMGWAFIGLLRSERD